MLSAYSPPRYTRTAIALHWLLALLILCGFCLGLYMTGLKFSPAKLVLYSYHKWIGVTVFSLALLRLLWRMGHKPPSLPPRMAPWQRHAAGALHALLYLLMLAIPLSGWLYSSSTGVPTVPFGISALQLPDLLERNKETADSLRFLHVTLNYSLAVMVALHVAAAFKHHFLDRDNLLDRMNPF
ncbi:MAG TPA: cytochrome b [Burkholderiales bacterium]|jgi:cytochrome b561|nr:cytochrome b [Burkholderiales bacterium]